MDYFTSDTALMGCILFSQAGDPTAVIFEMFLVSSTAQPTNFSIVFIKLHFSKLGFIYEIIGLNRPLYIFINILDIWRVVESFRGKDKPCNMLRIPIIITIQLFQPPHIFLIYQDEYFQNTTIIHDIRTPVTSLLCFSFTSIAMVFRLSQTFFEPRAHQTSYFFYLHLQMQS